MGQKHSLPAQRSRRVSAERSQQPCRNCHAGSEEHRNLHHPWCMQNQNQDEASNKGRKEGSLWQSGDGQSQASKKSGESLPCLCLEEKCVRAMESRCNACTCGASHMRYVDRLGKHLYLLRNLIDAH